MANNKMKILIATAFPTQGAGSGALVTTQAKSYVEDGHEVCIITGNNRTTFDKLDGVRYHLVPFTAEQKLLKEGEKPEVIDGQLPFNYLMFTTHTESTQNFWTADLKQIEDYREAYRKALADEVKTMNPNVIHAQHNWLLSATATEMGKPVVTTIHGTDLMGYIKAKSLVKFTEKIIKQLFDDAQNGTCAFSVEELEKIQAIYDQTDKYKDILARLKKEIKLKNSTSKSNLVIARDSGATKELVEEGIKIGFLNREVCNSISKFIEENGQKSKPIDLSKFTRELSQKDILKVFEERKKYQLYISESEKSAKNSNRIIVISDAQEEKFVSLFPFAKDKVELLENGYDPKTFYVDTNVDREYVLSQLHSDLTPDGKIDPNYDYMMLFVGKFADFKGIDSLLTAAKLYEDDFEKQGKKVLTIIVGSGALEKKLKAQRDALGLKNTHFVGRQGHAVIKDLQNLADASLIPSREEPFGLVVIEGTACGHPVIASNSGGIPGILNTEKRALPDQDIIATKLGLLVTPLPERPTELSDERKNQLDVMTPEYVVNPEKRQEVASSIFKEFPEVSEDKLELYLNKYSASTEALSKSVTGIAGGEYTFDDADIADYTKKSYAQPVIRDKLIGIFNAAKTDYELTHKKESARSIED